MAAWNHYKYWDSQMYEEYRKFVARDAPKFRGNEKLDCADISIILLINFAASNGLPTTFWDNNQVRYISKGTRQAPEDSRLLRTREWKDKDDYTKAVLERIGSKALVLHNTVVNPRGPEIGDLMAKMDHTALVFDVRPMKGISPKVSDTKIPVFPGPDIAKTQLHQTEYIRSRTSTAPVCQQHIDYLNHRGYGKEMAELMYEADVQEMKDQRFEFRMYKPGVIDNWIDWNGMDDPPR